MRNKILTFAGALALLAVLGHFYAKPLLSQVRAALVSDVDNPARGAVVIHKLALVGGSQGEGLTADLGYIVPSGKRLTIDTIAVESALVNVATLSFSLNVGTPGTSRPCTFTGPGQTLGPAVAYVPLIYSGFAFDRYWYANTIRVQTYADPGQCLAFNAVTADLLTSGRGYDVTVSGHLVSLP